MYVNYADLIGAFHGSTCPHSINREKGDRENEDWFDGVISEELARGLLEFIR
jgi:hypothetical protein